MKIIASSICNIGGRAYNQDYLSCVINDSSACLVVCDGLGSYIGSEVASRLCATKVVETYEQIFSLDKVRAVQPGFVQSYIQTAHNYVVSHKEKNPKIKSSCTTVACVVTDCKNTVFAHIGDSRVYYFKQGNLEYQSKDHSLAQVAVEMGEITLDQVRTHKDQNKLTRVLGGEYFAPPDMETADGALAVGDAFVLCSDGFWEYIFEDEMIEDIISSTNSAQALSKMEARLIRRIPKGNDNYTAIVAMVVEE